MDLVTGSSNENIVFAIPLVPIVFNVDIKHRRGIKAFVL